MILNTNISDSSNNAYQALNLFGDSIQTFTKTEVSLSRQMTIEQIKRLYLYRQYDRDRGGHWRKRAQILRTVWTTPGANGYQILIHTMKKLGFKPAGIAAYSELGYTFARVLPYPRNHTEIIHFVKTIIDREAS